jgi:hypothetical protein
VNDTVGLSGLNLTAASEGSFAVNASTAAAPDSVPPLEADGRQTVRYLELAPNASGALRNVTLRVAVAKDSVREPGSVTLARYNGTWEDLPTRLADETETHYRFAAESPGLSVFAVHAAGETTNGTDGTETTSETTGETTDATTQPSDNDTDAATTTEPSGAVPGFGPLATLAALAALLGLLARRRE